MLSILLQQDLYKYCHWNMYPKGTTKVYSYFCARNTRVPGIDKVVFFGMQYYLKKFFLDPITTKDKELFIKYVTAALGPDAVSPKILKDIDQLIEWGYLPLEIKALPEGSKVNLQVAMFTVTNTHPDFFWLSNFVETLLCHLWGTCTTATTAYRLRKLSEKHSQITCDNNDHVDFQFCDFSCRGQSSSESSCLVGAGHLLSFSGTDVMCALPTLETYYGGYTGFSVYASEHSTSCAYGESNEFEYFETLLDLYPKGILSLISDTYDYFRVMTDFLPKLRNKIMSRDGKTVFRPDGGDPEKIICGDPEADPNSPEYLGSLELLWGQFGGSYNSKGLRVLDSHVGLIYGDGIYYERAESIFNRMKEIGFASSNVVFGAGAFGYQYVSRDTFGFALKSSYVEVSGQGREIFKCPKTDLSKKSAKGLLAVYQDSRGHFYMLDKRSPEQEASQDNLLRTVFKDGVLYNEETFFEIRDRLHAQI